jgi:hypothetical protein
VKPRAGGCGVPQLPEARQSTTVRGREEVDLEANKALVRSFVEAWNTRDFDRFDVLMGEGAVLHIGGGQVQCDPAGTRAIAEEWTSAFPDWRFALRPGRSMTTPGSGANSGWHRPPDLRRADIGD